MKKNEEMILNNINNITEEMNKNLSNNFNNNKKTIGQLFNNITYKNINIERSERCNSNTKDININNYTGKIRNKSNNDFNNTIIDKQQIKKFQINKIKKIINEKNNKLGKLPGYQINKGSKQSIFVNKDNNFLNDNLNKKISNNLNLKNYNINQNQQVNYRKGYVKNINKQYNKMLLNNFQNYQFSGERINSNKKYLNFKYDNDKIIQKNINEGIIQRSITQNIKNTVIPY